MHTRILMYSVLAALSALAAVGLWFIWSTHPSLPLWLAIPVIGKLLFIAVALLLRQARRTAYEQGIASAQIDSATRLPAPNVALQILALEFAAAERGRDLVIVLFSVNNYRRIAAGEGGLAREKLLLGAGAVLRRRTRGMHVSAQYGVEGQFLSVLGGASIEGARTFAARVRKDLASLKVGPPAPIVSATIAAYEPGMASMEALIRKAEDGLRAAQRDGSGSLEVVNEPDFHLRAAAAYEIA